MAAAIAYSHNGSSGTVRARDILGTVFIYCEILRRLSKPNIVPAN